VFKDTAYPIIGCELVEFCCVFDVAFRGLDGFMAHVFFDAVDVVDPCLDFGLYEPCGGAPVSCAVWLELRPELFSIVAEFHPKMVWCEWFPIGLYPHMVFGLVGFCLWPPFV